eukprot:gene3625-4139_t
MALYIFGLCSRAVILFVTGSLLATMKLFEDISETKSYLSLGLMNSISYTWWIPLMIGVFACFVGLIYPCIDSKLGEPHYFRREWSSVVRCVIVFVGMNHFSTKSNFLANKSHQFLVLLCIGIALWWTFDRSTNGLGIGVIAATLATAFTFLVAHVIYRHSNFLYSKSWLPGLYFAGACTFGNVGRQLALMDPSLRKLWKISSQHHD